MWRMFLIVPVLHAYIGLRVIPDLPGGWPVAVIGVALLLASTALMPLAFAMRRHPHPRAALLAWCGFVAMGWFSSLWVLTVLRDLVLLLWMTLDLFAPALGTALPAFRIGSAVAIPVLATVASLWGYVNVRRRAAVRRVDVPIANLRSELNGFTIAQISDIHVGATIKHDYLAAIVNAVNGLHADMIAITGDLVDGSVAALAGDVKPLAQLKARHGAYFVTGNHEYYSGVEAWTPHLQRLGLHVLMNQHEVIRHDGAQMVVAGVTDYSAGHFSPDHASDPVRALAGAPADTFKLLLAHQPRSAPAAEAAGFDVQLSGHTHGGQFLPWNFFVRLQQPFTAGLKRLGKLWVYTSRGTGYWGPPLRLGAPSEITLLRLVPAA